MKTYRISIASRIDLYVNNDGFIFTNRIDKPRYFQKWSMWQNSWQPYVADGIKEKVKSFLDTFPDAFKSHDFYQNLKFSSEPDEHAAEKHYANYPGNFHGDN